MENSCDEKCSSDSVDSDLNKKDNLVSLVHPVVLQSPETALEFDTGSENSESEEWSGDVVKNNYVIPQNSTINVENSSDVIIGPLTQFHGPVTIYQNINVDNPPPQQNLSIQYKSDVVLNSSAKPTPESNATEKQHPTEKQHLVKSYRRIAIYISIIITMLISAVVSIVVSLNMTAKEGNDVSENYFPNEVSKIDPASGDFLILSKEKWGGKPAANTIKHLRHPIRYVFVCHTAGHLCKNFADCSSTVEQIQTMHIHQLNKADIKYNFLIGDDGNIYTGRGWDYRNEDKDNSISISFIGHFVKRDKLSPKMISALTYLLGVGVESKKLSKDYKLFCHNQTIVTASPGDNVYKEVSKLPNFQPGWVTIEE